MSDALNIAASKKRADLNVWLNSTFAPGDMIEKQIFLLGLAAGLQQIPEVDAQLSERGRNYIPDSSVAHDFIVSGIETWAAYYDGLAQISAALADFDAGDTTEAETVAAIDAIVPGQ
jgi:hypothetical protein